MNRVQTEPAPAQDEREAFEAWYVTSDFEGMPGNDRFERSPDGQYWYIGTRKSWDAWQARATHPAQTAPAITNAAQLCELLENVRALHEISADLIAEDVFRQLRVRAEVGK